LRMGTLLLRTAASERSVLPPTWQSSERRTRPRPTYPARRGGGWGSACLSPRARPRHDQPLDDGHEQIEPDADRAGEDDRRPRSLEVQERGVRRDVLAETGARGGEVLADDRTDGRQRRCEAKGREDVGQRVGDPQLAED